MTYEELLESDDNVFVQEINLFEINGLKGLYIDGCVAIDQNIKTQKEKACVLAEELGHHYTSTGNILDQTNTVNRKQEKVARFWAYNKQIGLLGIIKSYEYGCKNKFEIAEYLDVTEEFLCDSINCYRSKYSPYTILDNYIIYFEPNLGVMKRV